VRIYRKADLKPYQKLRTVWQRKELRKNAADSSYRQFEDLAADQLNCFFLIACRIRLYLAAIVKENMIKLQVFILASNFLFAMLETDQKLKLMGKVRGF